METKSLKNCTDEEIVDLYRRALEQIRQSPDQYGEIKTTVSGGRVKFMTLEIPIVRQ